MTYRFLLSESSSTVTGEDVGELHTDSHSRVWSSEEGRAFLRAKLSSGVILRPGQGYDEVNDAPYESEWKVVIERYDENNTPRHYFTGTFTKADCQIDEDTQRIVATLEPLDEYTSVLKNWSADYDLLKLGLKPAVFSFFEFPLIQVYFSGYRELFNLTPDRGWTADYGGNLRPTDDFEEYQFGEENRIVFIPGQVSEEVPDNIFGAYTYSPPVDGQGSSSYSYTQQGGAGAVIRVSSSGVPRLEVSVGGQVKYRRKPTTSENRALSSRGIYEFAGPTAGIDDEPLFVLIEVVYRARILLHTDNYQGQAAEEVSESDIYAGSVAYTHVAPYDLTGLSISDLSSSVSTDFGRFGQDSPFYPGNYFVRPAGVDFQLGGIGAGYASVWYTWPANDLASINALKERRTVNDGYLLKDVINALCLEASENETSHFDSQLLYNSTDPITSEDGVTYLVVPKSNILNRAYTNPASKALLKLSEVDELLKTVRNAKWHIDGLSLVFEHVAYYDNGRAYTPNIGLDLRSEEEATTRLPWEFYSNKFSYRKASIPQRITLKAMDTESDLFEDATLHINSRYANPDQTDDRRASVFSFDIDHAISFPRSYSETGFFLVACREETYDERGETVTELQVVSGSIDQSGSAQNHILSRRYCLENYYQNAAPAQSMTIAGNPIEAVSLARNREQKIKIGYLENANYDQLIQVTAGDGIVDGATEKMTTGETEITLLHEPK